MLEHKTINLSTGTEKLRIESPRTDTISRTPVGSVTTVTAPTGTGTIFNQAVETFPCVGVANLQLPFVPSENALYKISQDWMFLFVSCAILITVAILVGAFRIGHAIDTGQFEEEEYEEMKRCEGVLSTSGAIDDTQCVLRSGHSGPHNFSGAD
jgi:hypothetical protein